MNEINCPKCNEIKIVKYGKDRKTQKYKCKQCGSIFRENKNYNFESKAESTFFYTLFNLATIKHLPFLVYLPQVEKIKGVSTLNFKKIEPDPKTNRDKYRNISARLIADSSDELKDLTPELRIYLKDGEIIVAKRL